MEQSRQGRNGLLARAGPAETHRGWIYAIAGLLAAASIVTLVTWDSARSIVSIWSRSDTFAHGFLILPISLWLIWEKRKALAHMTPEPAIWAAALSLPVGAVWMAARAVDVLVVEQFAYVALLLTSCLAVLGTRVFRFLLFPLLFLFFAVPVGEGLVQPMINFTADFTVGMLKLTGIPVFREGSIFMIPSGKWSVVEACSGVRYLIASVTLGVLFAYLTYVKWYKRLIFVLFSILVPVIANGFRAYMIVMIGHLSDMKLATGVDHLVYGWVFFGIVIFTMFLIGGIWRDADREERPTEPSRERASPKRFAVVLLAVAVALLPWVALGSLMEQRPGQGVSNRVQLPQAIGSWTGTGPELFGWEPEVTGAELVLKRLFTSGSEAVGVYVGLFGRGPHSKEMVTSSNAMVTEANPNWTRLEERVRPVALKGSTSSVREHIIVDQAGRQLLVWSWYRIGGSDVTSPYLGKFLDLWTRVIGSRRGEAIVALATEHEERLDVSRARLARFAEDALPRLQIAVDDSLAGVTD